MKGFCPVGETYAKQQLEEKKVPVLSSKREVNPMNTQRGGFPFFPVVLVAAALALVVAAALTTWWLLLGLIPLTMMLGCATMMTAGRMPCAPRASRGSTGSSRSTP